MLPYIVVNKLDSDPFSGTAQTVPQSQSLKPSLVLYEKSNGHRIGEDVFENKLHRAGAHLLQDASVKRRRGESE